MRQEAARPRGMVRRRIRPSCPRAPHMGAAMAILKGEEMDPREAPTVRPAARYTAETLSKAGGMHLQIPEEHEGGHAVAGQKGAHPAQQGHEHGVEAAGIGLQPHGQHPGDIVGLGQADKTLGVARIGDDLAHGPEQAHGGQGPPALAQAGGQHRPALDVSENRQRHPQGQKQV